jgi:hypothetical protein
MARIVDHANAPHAAHGLRIPPAIAKLPPPPPSQAHEPLPGDLAGAAALHPVRLPRARHAAAVPHDCVPPPGWVARPLPSVGSLVAPGMFMPKAGCEGLRRSPPASARCCAADKEAGALFQALPHPGRGAAAL